MANVDYDSVFLAQIGAALTVTKQVLHTSRDPRYPHDVPHSYDDKYLLVEYLVNTAVASTLTSLEALGLTPDHLKAVKEWSTTRSVTLRLAVQYVSP
jgi:hypothetical protein